MSRDIRASYHLRGGEFGGADGPDGCPNAKAAEHQGSDDGNQPSLNISQI